ncbi:hypothetical protein PHMEG_00027645 [Phytophthora megakarya]|uniref:HAT C-terminal dimerisation domain-containing protein n=1 Tax=Phytophthora megakarya TaxID=4795 RepID=A0A225V7E3_9STRA|nr:hypothetical protein PHMEG_00027645 [Phytophthora megakarya]
MTGFDVIAGTLQRNDMTVATVHDIFDILLDNYAVMETFLAMDANIVESGALKSKDTSAQGPQSKYIDAIWIPAASVMAGRFFLTVKSTVGYLRKSLSQENLAMIMYLKLNGDLVMLVDLSKAIERANQTNDAVVM